MERVAPFDDRPVEVRMTRRDRLQPAEVLDKLDGPLIKESGRIPQQIALAGRDDQPPLADRHGRVCADPDQPALDLA